MEQLPAKSFSNQVPQDVAAIPTPALVLHKEPFLSNIRAMQAHCAGHQCSLRPHAKTHKSSTIAKLQIEAGAVGICCATVDETTAMAKGGIDDILITSPVVTPHGQARAIKLARAGVALKLVADNALNIASLARLASANRLQLDVLIDLDPGMHRTGIEPGETALSLVQQIRKADSLRFRGLQMYAGDAQHIGKYAQRRQRTDAVLQELRGFLDELSSHGIDCDIVTGGGTGTFDLDPVQHVFSELQAGSYAFMDRQYMEVEARHGGSLPFEPSLYVLTTVVSANRHGRATTDAGLKSMATEADVPLIARGAPSGSDYFFMGDEHGGVHYDNGDRALTIGDRLWLLTPHCDPTVNLFDVLWVVDDQDRVEAIWPIDGRRVGLPC